jgi:outer membrane protein
MLRALFLLLPAVLCAEVHTLTLQEAVAVALKQNPDVLIARIDQQRAVLSAQVARDPFLPKVYAGSGLAYTYGYPLSIEGSAPSIVQVKGVMSLYNPAARFQVAQAKENVRTATLDEGAKRDEVMHRVAAAFLDAQYLGRSREAARNQLGSFEKVEQTVKARVEEGRELPIELSRASVSILRARQRLDALEADADFAEANLAVLLGYGVQDRVRPIESNNNGPAAVPASESAAIETALANSKDVKRLESQMQAKGFEARSYRAQRLPKIDLVAQYGLFSRFNNFEDFFQRFQQNNATVGASIQIPIIAPAGARASASRADAEVERLRLEMVSTRDRLSLETRRAWQNVQRTQNAQRLAQADLDLAREQLNVLLAQFGEGRATLRQVEEARTAENERWIGFYDSGLALERARLELLRHTGELAAALR